MSVDALAIGARVRWLPSSDPRVVGYELWVRAAGAPYGQPTDLGLPDENPDGTHDAVVEDLDAGGTYYFSVHAYTEEGMRSPCAGELALGPREICEVDSCCLGGCTFAVVPDGTPCEVADACRACDAGSCRAPASETTLDATQLRLVDLPTKARATLKGWFVPPASADPDVRGLVIALLDHEGAPAYLANVPPTAFRVNRARTAFSLVRGSDVPGLRTLSLRRRGDDVRLRARVSDPSLSGVAALPASSAVIRIGDRCVRPPDLECLRRRRTLVCS